LKDFAGRDVLSDHVHGEIRRALHGYEPTPEAAMAAFAKSWRRS
jgi:hypothetical protein